MTTTAARIGSSATVHAARIIDGRPSVSCGAVRYRSTARSTVKLTDAEVTCTKCRKATAPTRPEFYGKPINTPAGHRWAGYTR